MDYINTTEPHLPDTIRDIVLLRGIPDPLPGENFRSLLGRFVRMQPLTRDQRRLTLKTLLKQYRTLDLPVNAPAVDYLAKLRYEFGVAK